MYGVDTSSALLRKARERGINVIQARAEGLPFKDKTFESLLMVVSICFFERPLEALLEAKRVLRKDGMLLLGLVLSDSPWARFYQQKAQQGHPLYSVARFYSFEEIKGMLSQAGFRLSGVAITLFDPPQDTKEVENTDIKEGYYPEGGFFCLMATP